MGGVGLRQIALPSACGVPGGVKARPALIGKMMQQARQGRYRPVGRLTQDVLRGNHAFGSESWRSKELGIFLANQTFRPQGRGLGRIRSPSARPGFLART